MAYLGREPLGGEVILMNSIESQFNGVLTTFNLTHTVSGVTSAFYPVGSEQLLVSLGGVIQKPDPTGNTGFRISFNTIIFAIAPAAGTSCFIISYGNLTDIGAPANNTVTTDKLVDGSVTPPKLSTGGIYWTTDGNVGIGTTNPTQKLHVIGKALITNDIQLTGSNPRIDFNLNGSSALRFWDITNNAERVRIDTSGRLGVGTVSPYYFLDVRFDNATTSLSGGSSGNWDGQGIRIQNDNQTVGAMALAHFRTYDGDWHIGSKYYADGGDTDFIFLQEGVNEKLRIKGSSGNVGIGTNNPQTQLHVYQSVNGLSHSNSSNQWIKTHLQSNINYARFDINGGGVAVGDDVTETPHHYLISYGTGHANTPEFAIKNNIGPLRFYTGDNPVNSTPRLSILTDGNVGIGTAGPNAKLEVFGADTTIISRPSGITASAPSLGWPVHNAEQDNNSKYALVLETAGNGSIVTAGYGATVTLRMCGYYDSRAVITPVGAGSGSPSDQGSGYGKDLYLKAGRSDNGVGKIGGRLFLSGGSGYDSGGYDANYGVVSIQPHGGRVGIGTTNPLTKLDVRGSILVKNLANANGSSSIMIGGTITNGNLTDFGAAIGVVTENQGANAYGMQLFTRASYLVDQTEKVRITGSGNVGIGTTNPAAKLEVNGGNARFGRSGLSILVRNAINSISGATLPATFVACTTDGGTNTALVYWNQNYGSNQTQGCLGAVTTTDTIVPPNTSVGYGCTIYGVVGRY